MFDDSVASQQITDYLRSLIKESTGILKELEEQLDATYLSTQYHYKVNNMLQNSLAILEAAYKRKESVGAHYIIDDEVK